MSENKEETLLYNIALSLIPNLGPYAFKNIISYCGSAQHFLTMPAGKAAKIPGIGLKLLEGRKKKDQYLKKAEEIINDTHINDLQIHTYMEKSYPSRLKSFVDAPVLLFSKGQMDLNPPKTIGIVGTRNASEYGKNITRKIVEDLAPYKPTIISGLAYGIDIESHRAALINELPTIGVLGASLDNIYPAPHKVTAQSMMANGGLLTEYKMGTNIHAKNFPARNRIIAALSDALIVVEAAKKGGALITAEISHSYNREVFAVPGNLQNTYSEGCNNLIRNMKAGIYMGAKDIEEALSWTKEKEGSIHGKANKKINLSQFSPSEKTILQTLSDAQSLEIDRLSWQTQIPVSQLASLLLNLEFQGLVKSLPGKKYSII
ncbi:DNA-processing protein DprA [Echinicola jeungdonensis]|uniref:DNA-processing protein DprA n=1 Tax=Echinicola jeungdonensis TaxID=709343 RepID=A0ABV5J0M7_9BACT|nr:DNA-processing protein DprA [Echinicola jeungdonensis]MDN3667818.1 DNA-processing protein DprA [Echinicola jeungdonensis]